MIFIQELNFKWISKNTIIKMISQSSNFLQNRQNKLNMKTNTNQNNTFSDKNYQQNWFNKIISNLYINFQLLFVHISLLFQQQYLFIQQMSLNLPKFKRVMDFTPILEELEKSYTIETIGRSDSKNIIETSDCLPQCSNKSRSIKANNKGCQLTFQSNILKQHIETFDFYVQSYLGQIFSGHRLIGKKFTNQAIFPRKSILNYQTMELKDYLNSFQNIMGQQKANLFLQDLSHQHNLYEFLTYICKNSCDQVAYQILMISNQIWQKYLIIQHTVFTYEALIDYSKILVQQCLNTIKSNNLIKYITLDKSFLQPSVNSQEIDNEQKKFFSFLIVTILLVIFQFFSNPYYENKVNSKLKRHIFFNNSCSFDSYDNYSEQEPDEDEYMFSKSRKKRK